MRSSLRGWRRGLSIGVVAACVAVPSIAAAADPAKGGPDTLTLQDGTILSGTFTEFVPNNRVTVLVNGESKTYQWNLVRKAAHDGKVVAENQPAPLPPPVVVVQPQPNQQVVVVQGQPPGQPAQGALEESVLVHLEGEEDAVLEMQDRTEKGSYAQVCHAPCDKTVPLDRMYRITGEGIRDSRAFKLAGSAGKAVTVDVNPGRKGGFVGGLVMTVIGPLAFISGLFVYAAGSVRFNISFGGSSASSNNDSLQVVGGVMMLAGAALTAVGIPLMVSNIRTKVTQEVGTPGPRHDSMLRTPMFRDVAHQMPIPQVSTVPFFTRAF